MTKIVSVLRRKYVADLRPADETNKGFLSADARKPSSLSYGMTVPTISGNGVDGDVLKPKADELERLYDALGHVTKTDHPRTAKLLESSRRKIAQKAIEEAGEVALEAIRHRNRDVVRESADLLYHLTVLWRRAGIEPSEVWAEMHQRAAATGSAEKLPKTVRQTE